jgi:hypothetical protein
MCKGWRTCWTCSLISTCAKSLMSLVGVPRWVMLSRSTLTNCLSDLLDRIHICSVGLSTNKELSRGNATIDCQSVRVDGIGSHWFITRMQVQGGIWDLYHFLSIVLMGMHASWVVCSNISFLIVNFRMNTRSGRYGAPYIMVGLRCFNEELLLLPKNRTEAKLQAMSTWGESTEPT